MEWEEQAISFYNDSNIYFTATRTAVIAAGGVWVYDHPFFKILNVAVGGNWPGGLDSTTQFPQDMIVDYVRVYRGTAAS